MSKKVLITGATGMVGGELLKLCLNHKEIEKVISVSRKLSGIKHEKLEEWVRDDLGSFDDVKEQLQGVDVVFYCIGVYTGAVSKELFRAITVDYPVALGKVLKEVNPTVKFCLLSGSGADRTEKSRMMFARDKGAAENQLADLKLGGFHTFRPGYIYPVTKREEPNFGYRLSRAMYPLLKLMGKSMSIKSTELAEGMLTVGLNGNKKEVFENRDILSVLESK